MTRTTTGGSIRPARVDTLPLRIPDPKTDSDPFRAWEALTAGLGRGERARIQILARPATGRRLRRYRRTVGRAHTCRAGRPSMLSGVLTAVLREVLDLVTGAHGTRPHPLSGYGIPPGRPNPQRTEELTAIRGKAAHPQWETAIRYTATTPGLDDRARDRARGIADAVFAPFALTVGLNYLTRHRLPHPARALAGRRLRRGALLSVPELAALAHLPSATTVLAGDTARRIPAPTQATNAALSRGNS